MRTALIFKVALALCLALSLTGLAAAEYRNGQLYIEVLLCSGASIELEAESSAATKVVVSERESPLSLGIDTPIRISLDNSATLSSWSWLESSRPWDTDSNGVLRESFAWEDSSLVIKRENLVYSEHSFADKATALRFAREAGVSEEKVQGIPLLHATVRVTGAKGAARYLETPLHLSSADPLCLNGDELGFSGEFLLKCVEGRLVLTHLLPLEDYVAGVIANEIGSKAPLEAMKAQAVAARTHAVSLLLSNSHKKDGYDLCNATHCQVYKGKYRQNETVRLAASSTASEILIREGRVADATYHSCCGGRTDSSKAIWDGAPLPHLGGVLCDEAAAGLNLADEADARRWILEETAEKGNSAWEASALAWSRQLKRRELAKNVGLADIDHLVINRRGASGRITDITFHGEKAVRLTSEYRIRQAFGGAKSSFFYIEGGFVTTDNGGVVIYPPETVSIKGRGSGHGVGMCQVGALKMARAGDDHLQILSHYYPGTEISTQWMQHE